MNDLNQYLQPLNAPVTQKRSTMDMDFNGYEVQTLWRKNKIIKDALMPSNLGTATSSLSNGDAVTFTAILTPSIIDPEVEHVAVCFVDVYQGANPLAAYRIFPDRGSSIGGGVYEAYGGYLYEASYPYRSTYEVYIRNISAGVISVGISAQWKLIADRSGVTA